MKFNTKKLKLLLENSKKIHKKIQNLNLGLVCWEDIRKVSLDTVSTLKSYQY